MSPTECACTYLVVVYSRGSISLGRPLNLTMHRRPPISLPWHRESIIYPGQLLHSRLLHEKDPWSSRSPFRAHHDADVDGKDLVYSTVEAGGTGTFRSVKISSSTNRQDHESYAFAGQADAYIAKASGKLQYDRHLSENKHVSFTPTTGLGSPPLYDGQDSLNKTAPTSDRA